MINIKSSALGKAIRKSALTKVFLFIIILFIFAAVFAPFLTPYTPYEQNLKEKMAPPSSSHLLGTDHLGRDFFTRLLYGARISCISSLLSGIIAAVIGTTLGMIAGYYTGFASQVIMRFTDAMVSIPAIILNIVLASIMGGDIIGLSFVIGIGLIPTYIRMVNSVVLSLKQNDYILASKLVGIPAYKIMFRHLLPNCYTSLIVIFTMNLGTSIMREANLSFLSVGITPPTPAWGTMVSEGYKYLIREPRLAIIPGLCVLIIVVSFNMVGDVLRDALDPRLRGKL